MVPSPYGCGSHSRLPGWDTADVTEHLTIPPPDPARPPLRANVFACAQTTATTLVPLFPYLDEGAIVPCISVFRGGPGRRYGRFQHFNTVDEVIMMFGSPPGMVFVGPKLHPVGAPFEDVEDPGSTSVALITQRQVIGDSQREEYRFLCEGCQRRLSVFGFDATPAKRGEQPPHAPFPTLVEGRAAAEQHNAREADLTCRHCGHENPPFPVEYWGWTEYAEQTRVAAHAEQSMRAASTAVVGEREAEA